MFYPLFLIHDSLFPWISGIIKLKGLLNLTSLNIITVKIDTEIIQ